MIRVRTPQRSYSAKRFIFVDHGVEVEVTREMDVCALWNGLLYRAAHRTSALYTFHVPSPLSRADLFHLYNTSSVSHRPWVVTVENWPFSRLGPIDRAKLVAGEHCKRVLGISNWVREQYERNVGDSVVGREILAKMVVLPPPQAILPNDSEPVADRIRMCFVGTSFFRKGGLEVLRAFDQVYPRHRALQLEIVSSMDTESYPEETSFTHTDVDEAIRLIRRHPDGVVWHKQLPNDQCLALMSRSHVGLLPSYFDTYGYAALEMMAAGCPVVATNQRALGEIVSERRGWVVEMSLNAHATIDRDTEAQRRNASELMVDQLVGIFETLATSPEEIRVRGLAAQAYIRETHDPTVYASNLRDVYRAALSN